MPADSDAEPSLELERLKIRCQLQDKKLQGMQAAEDAAKAMKKRVREVEDELYKLREDKKLSDENNKALTTAKDEL